VKKKIMLLGLLGFVLIGGNVAQAATFTVNTTDDTVDVYPGDGVAADADGYCSLRAAIMEANALAGRDTIVLPEGIFTLTIEGTQEDKCLSGDLDIKSNMVIQGAGWDLTVIDGNQIDRVFQIQGNMDVAISDLTIRNGKTPDGGSPPSLTVGGSGGGILNRFTTLNIENCKILTNRTGKGGENYMGYGPPGGYGGGIYNKEGTISLKNSSIGNNITGRGGDGYYGGSGGHGGGIFNGNGSTLTLDNCTIYMNLTGSYGSGAEDGNGGGGGGIYNTGELTVIDCTVKDNLCGDGGFEGSGGSGGGIYNYSSGSAEISRSLIAGNITGDSHDMPAGGGGGICNRGYLALKNCTLSGNRTMPHDYLGAGGGVYNDGGDATILNCTICRNIGHQKGGGIANSFNGFPLRIKNTIIANNSLGHPWAEDLIPDDCSGTIISLGYNLIENTAGCTIKGNETGNIYGSGPLIGALADNGGPTMTHKLLPASLAIDTGHPSEFEKTDQRGVIRPKDGDGVGGARSDMGAFELFLPSVTIASPDAGDSVCGTISIEAAANTVYVDFYIDNVLLCESVTSPFLCSWDTIPYANGSHKIKAKAYNDESIRLAAQDQVDVFVDNASISLNVSRIADKAWIIRREYGVVSFEVTHPGCGAVTKYILERREEGGAFSPIVEIDESELAGSSKTYNDPLPVKNVSYTYRVIAVDSADMTVGLSQEVTI
jgi:CSLREA domain-containing protein